MGIVSLIKKMMDKEQTRLEKELEEKATPEEKEAIRLINHYSKFIINRRTVRASPKLPPLSIMRNLLMWYYNKKDTAYGANLPSSEPKQKLYNVYTAPRKPVLSKSGRCSDGYTHVLPGSYTPVPAEKPEYPKEFLLMKSFLESYTGYKTKAAEKIRDFYSFK